MSEFTFEDAMALAPAAMAEAMVECGCGHYRWQHIDDSCRGTGADLDSEYRIPPDEPCSCTTFEPLQDAPGSPQTEEDPTSGT